MATISSMHGKDVSSAGKDYTFGHKVGVAGVFAGNDLLYKLVVTQFPNRVHSLGTLQQGEGGVIKKKNLKSFQEEN